jgi:hypothetical protein
MSRSILAIVLLVASISVVAPSSVRASDTGAPTLLVAGEMGAYSFNHVILIWDEILDERVAPVASEFFITVAGIEQPAAAARYLVSGLGGAQSVLSASGITIMRLDLQPGVTVDQYSSFQIRYSPGPASLQDLSLNKAAGFSGFAGQIFTGIGSGFLAPFVDADHGTSHIALSFFSRIDPLSIPTGSDFAVTVTRGAGVFSDPVTSVQPSFCSHGFCYPDLGLGFVDLVLAIPLASGDAVTVSYTPGTAPLRELGGAAFAPIVEAVVNVSLASDYTQVTLVAPGPVTTYTGTPTTAFDPVATTVTSPVAATITLNEQRVDLNPAGYTLFGKQVEITTSVAATTANPFVFRFDLDASLIPPGETQDTVVVRRNGTPVGACTGAAGQAVPTPCVSLRALLHGGDAEGDIAITVLTEAASIWTFATVRPYAFGGFLRPVDNRPVVNTTNSGSAIPVKFSLGGDRGMAIFVSGSPASQQIPCDATASTDPVETTASPGSATLTYSSGTDAYTYVWKTDKAWAGTCRRLILGFGDGSTRDALFKFGK